MSRPPPQILGARPQSLLSLRPWALPYIGGRWPGLSAEPKVTFAVRLLFIYFPPSREYKAESTANSLPGTIIFINNAVFHGDFPLLMPRCEYATGVLKTIALRSIPTFLAVTDRNPSPRLTYRLKCDCRPNQTVFEYDHFPL